MEEVAAAQSAVFAANRARSRVALSVAAAESATRRERVHEEGSLRLRFPNTHTAECEAVIVNTAGGVAGGDRIDLEISLRPRAQLVVCGAAAEKIYRAGGADTQMSVRLHVGQGAALRWLPQETILFDRARLTRRIDVDLHGDASLVMVESIVFGRAAMGEVVREGMVTDRWRVRRDGRLVFAETLRLDGDLAGQLSSPAIGHGAAAIAAILVAPGDEGLSGRLREVAFAGEAGVSSWNGLTLVRLCARDAAALRQDVVAILAALGRGALPRLWVN